MDNITVEGFVSFRETKQGNAFASVYAGDNIRIATFAKADIEKLVAFAKAHGGFTKVVHPATDTVAEWSETQATNRMRVELRPTGRSEDGTLVFAALVGVEPIERVTLAELDIPAELELPTRTLTRKA